MNDLDRIEIERRLDALEKAFKELIDSLVYEKKWRI